MDEYEVILRTNIPKFRFLGKIVDVGKILVVGVVLILLIKTVLKGLEPFADIDVDLVLKMIDRLKLGSILGYFGWLLTTLIVFKERKGKRRAIREKKKYQKIAEEQDAYRSSSNLTEIGTTP